ncbi:MAG: 4-alpha-glucanotransferase, partial [Bacteroidales bacterium]|nr:4-alpha-glucanotransferase [Bacteroidales bacterium]
YYSMLHGTGEVPYFCEPWVCEKILSSHVKSPAMLCILPLQDWLSMDGTIRYQGNPADERINVPAIPRYYWRYRMHLTVESLIGEASFNGRMKGMIRESGRGV